MTWILGTIKNLYDRFDSGCFGNNKRCHRVVDSLIQLQHVSHPRGPQESQDNRSYINIRKWLKRAFMLFGIPFIVLLVYREWDSVKEIGSDVAGFLSKEVNFKATFADFQEKNIEIHGVRPGYYKVSLRPDREEYSYVCPGAGGVTPAYSIGGDGFGNILVQGSINGTSVKDGGAILIDDGVLRFSFSFPPIQWRAIQSCKAIIIGGLIVKGYLKSQ